jgi:myo-inositol catabolism protein IolC
MSAPHLFVLAVDQRPWLTHALWGHTGTATPDQRAAAALAKHAVLDGLLAAVDGGVPREAAGLLVDDELGPGVAERARAAGVTVSMPLERAGLDLYEDAPADVAAFLAHHAPDLAKVLVRYNPEGDADANALQRRRLAATARAAHEAGSRFLFELLVPATPQQRDSGDADTWAEEVRPGLTLRAMEEIVADVPVDVWKLESLGPEQAYTDAVALAATHDATCLLLGAGAPTEQVDDWLTRAARSGFAGFAVGRSIWWDAVRGLLAGETVHASAVSTVAERYRHFVDVFRDASRRDEPLTVTGRSSA